MAENIVELLTDVADAIREKKGTSEPINAQNFADEIKNLPSGEGGGDNGLAKAFVNRTITEYVDNEITEIGEFAFRGCFSLTKVAVPNARKINIAAFSRCSLLDQVDAQKASEFFTQAFEECSSLTKVAFPNATSIAAHQFRLCTSLQRVDAGVSTKIDPYAFYACFALDTLILRSTTLCTLASLTLQDTPIASGTGFVYVPDELVETYKSATNWTAFADQIKPISELPNE